MKRELLIVGLGLFALLMVAWLGVRMLYPPPIEPPTWTPTPEPSATARPTPPAEEPPDEEEEEPPLVAKVAWCHCVPPYGECVDLKLTWAAAALAHEEGQEPPVLHTHDYPGRCLSEDEEDHALWRLVEAARHEGRGPGRGQPVDAYLLGPAVWAPADRAACRAEGRC